MNLKRVQPYKNFALALVLSTQLAQAGSLNSGNTFNIDSQPLDAALAQFSVQSDILIVAPQQLVAGKRAPVVQGEMSNSEALRMLLKGSGLRYAERKDGQVVIEAEGGADGEQENNVRSESFLFEEIVVTAQKRAQNIQDVPMSISSLGSEDIERQNLVGMADYLNTIPGVTQQEFGVGSNQIVMRGIAASESEDATVGVYFGDMPLTNIGSGNSVDLKLVDIERVEVIRGPQGTLYGSGSMGGTIRNIPVSPDLQELGGKIKIGVSNTADTGSDNNSIVAVVNAPIIGDELAVRIAAYRFDNSGYIENVGASNPDRAALAELYGATVVDESNVGSTEYTGVRASVLWNLTDNFTATFIQGTQDLEQQGYSEVNPALGGYRDFPFSVGELNDGHEMLTDDIDFSSLTLEYDFDALTMLSVSNWYKGNYDFVRDTGRIVPFPLPQVFDTGKKGFVQELRITSQLDGPLQYIAGVYYENLENSISSHIFWGGDIDKMPDFLGTDPDALFESELSFHTQQHAVFSEFSYEVNDQFELTWGGRWFSYDRTDHNIQRGALAGEGVEQNNEVTEDGSSYKANVTYTPDGDSLFYAQWAQGFRLGRPVAPAAAEVCDIDGDGLLDGTNAPINPGRVDSDFLDSYELGAKFTFLDNRLLLNASIYRIEWEGIPVLVLAQPNCGHGVFINAGQARSEGVELESEYYFSQNFSVNFGVSYIDAELSKDDPVLGEEGSRLPNSSRVTANVSLEYDFELIGYQSFVRSNYSYVGGFHNDLAEQSLEAGGYGKWNMRAGITLDQFSVEIFGDNLTNADDLTAIYSLGANRLKPRTVGVDIMYQFN